MRGYSLQSGSFLREVSDSRQSKVKRVGGSSVGRIANGSGQQEKRRLHSTRYGGNTIQRDAAVFIQQGMEQVPSRWVTLASRS